MNFIKAKPNLKRWVNDFEVLDFVVHQAASTVGVMLVSILIVFATALLCSALAKNASIAFTDRIAEQRIFSLFNQPYYVAPLLCGLALGILGRFFSPSRSALWVWALPMTFLVWNLLTWKGAGPPTTAAYWNDVWANYFGSDCGGSECMYQVFITLPFYTSVVYSLGWAGASVLRGRNVPGDHPGAA